MLACKGAVEHVTTILLRLLTSSVYNRIKSKGLPTNPKEWQVPLSLNLASLACKTKDCPTISSSTPGNVALMYYALLKGEARQKFREKPSGGVVHTFQ